LWRSLDAGRPRNHSVSDGGKTFLSSPKRADRLRNVEWVPETFSAGVKWPSRETDHWPTDVKVLHFSVYVCGVHRDGLRYDYFALLHGQMSVLRQQVSSKCC
jgi:hypothetical protein